MPKNQEHVGTYHWNIPEPEKTSILDTVQNHENSFKTVSRLMFSHVQPFF